MLSFLGNGWAIGLSTITVEDFNDLWALLDPLNNTARKLLFTQVYRMIPSTCLDENMEQVPCWVLVTNFWPTLAAFLFTPAAVCAEECELVRFHELGYS